jgi:Mrp family chromosome partitioning ATPase
VGTRASGRSALLTDYKTTSAYAQAFYTLFANMRFHREDEHRLATHQQPPVQTLPVTSTATYNEQAAIPTNRTVGAAQRGMETLLVESARQQAGVPEAFAQQRPALAPVHTLLVTCASAYKDRATVAANLAIVAAQSGAETILVDADLSAPGLQQRFAYPAGAGLSDLLAEGDITAESVAACLQATFVPGLRILRAGTALARGAALLFSSHLDSVVRVLSELLAASEKPSGMALFHSAPVLSGADASLIGALTAQTVLAVIVGQTTRVQARQAQEQLAQAHVGLAGVLLLHP